MPISQGKVTLGATQPARLAGNVACRGFAITCPSSNSAAVTVAGNKESTNGYPIEPGGDVSISEGGGLDDLWVSGTSGDVIYWLAAA